MDFNFFKFFGVFLIGFDPALTNEKLAPGLVTMMSFFYGGSQVFSRYLKELDVIYIMLLWL